MSSKVVIHPIPGKCPIPHNEISLAFVVGLWVWGALSSRAFFLGLFLVFAMWAGNLFTTKTGGVVKPESEEGAIVTLSHGDVFYSLEGNKNSDTLIVLVHGFSTPSSVFRETAAAILQKFPNRQLLRFDLYGRGYSQAKDVPQTEALFVSQLVEILFALKLSEKKIQLIGYSMGGAISAHFTQLYPHKVEKLVLIAPAGMPADLPPAAQLLNVPLVRNVAAKFVWPKRLSSDHTNMTRLGEVAKRVAQEAGQQLLSPYFYRSLLSTVNNFPLRGMTPVYSQLGLLHNRPPILLLWGDLDPVCPYAGAKPLLELLNKSGDNEPATLITIPKGMHSLFLEQPGQCHPPLLEFLAGK